MVQALLNFRKPDNYDTNNTKLHACIQLCVNLQKLFGFMTKSNKKYANPQMILNFLVDE